MDFTVSIGSWLPRALLLGALLFGRGAEGQIRGVVMDGDGAPLEGVVVEAWADEGRLTSRISDLEGAFSFPAAVADRTVLLRAGRLGYRLLTLAVEPGPGEYRLGMSEEPISLQELVVESERNLCEIDDEPRARDLWDRLRRRYSGLMDTVGVATYVGRTERLVARDEIGLLEIPERMLSQRGSSRQLRFSWTRRALRAGYAFPVRRTEEGRSFDSWAYAPLEADFAPHFVDEAFGDLHRLRIRDEGDFGWIIEFCPRSLEEPSIRGALSVEPDTTLLTVRWLFQTPAPDENAGGRATFPPLRGPPERSHALPTESVFWRKLPTGQYQEVHRRFEEWTVAPGDTVPFLPRRRPPP